jgi:hypothetical protein
MNCSIEGCENVAHCKGLCSTHRRRERLYGSPLITKNNPPGTGFEALGYRATQINGKKKFDHVRIAESVLGRELPDGAVVHHADGNRGNNAKSNLVICPSKSYHNLLHARISAMNATGDPNKRKCRLCHEYDELNNLSSCKVNTSTAYWHKSCHSIYQKQIKQKELKC